MAEQPGQERTEEPTPRRLQKAQDDGQVARSPELLTSVVLLGSLVSIGAFGVPRIGRLAAEQLYAAGAGLRLAPLDVDGASILVRQSATATLLVLVPVLLAIAVPALAMGTLQARGVLSAKPITPDLSRLSPLKGFGRLLGGDAVATLLKATAKVVILGVVTWLALDAIWPTLAALPGASAGAVTEAARVVIIRVVGITGLAFLVLAGADYAWQLRQHRAKLRMTRQEIVQEHREDQGDPMLRSRRRSIALDLSRRRMLQDVKSATVVVVNPTSIAVALRYDPASDGAPVIVAMGRRKLAERIRETARKAGIPVVQNIPVARALIAGGKVGKPIPAALYAAVAEVLAFVYRSRRKAGSTLLQPGGAS
jgi:flagellar biosynthetic protein FlhB